MRETGDAINFFGSTIRRGEGHVVYFCGGWEGGTTRKGRGKFSIGGDEGKEGRLESSDIRTANWIKPRIHHDRARADLDGSGTSEYGGSQGGVR